MFQRAPGGLCAPPWCWAGSQGEQKSLLPRSQGTPLLSASLAVSAQAHGYYGQQDLVSELILVGVQGFVNWEVKDSWR